MKFLFVSPKKIGCEVEDLFEIIVNEGMNIRELKRYLCQYYNSWNNDQPEDKKKSFVLESPEQLRLREIYSTYPSTVLVDTSLVKAAVRSIYSMPRIGLQIVPVEDKLRSTDIVLFFQQFYPSKYDLGDKFELCLSQDSELDSIRAKIESITGCQNISFLPRNRWDPVKLLELPTLKWYNVGDEIETHNVLVAEWSDDDEEMTVYSNPVLEKGNILKKLEVKDGDLILFKDKEEPLRELTTKERSEMKVADETVTAHYSAMKWDAEEQLSIRQKDVDIDFGLENPPDLLEDEQ